MKIAIEGCAHGELEKIYDCIQRLEEREKIKVDLLLCCGDFQSTRNLHDLRCMAVPPKFYNICTFYKYYSGEKTAPVLTIFVGGNHEASNYLQELAYGGWVAPNIYYLGYAGVINVAGIRIAGISGIYKGRDYCKGRYEISPYSEDTKRSVYHIRNIDIFRLKQISEPVHIFMSHDWPNEITKFGNVNQLVKRKPHFRQDIETDNLGSAPAQELLNHMKPDYWFSAHLHCKFAAVVPHQEEDKTLKKITKFLALDKCLPRRRFLQVVDIPHDENSEINIEYDIEWLTVLHLTNHLINIKNIHQYMPGPHGGERWIFTPTPEEKEFILKKFDSNLTVPKNFTPIAKAYDPEIEEKNISQPPGQTNPQTTTFCDILGIDDPTNLILLSREKTSTPSQDLTKFIPSSVERNLKNRLNLSLPEPKISNSPEIVTEKLNLTLPAPKNDITDLEVSLNRSNVETESPKTEVSNLDLSTESFLDVDFNTSTPQKKKFKRRNESIYRTED